MNTRIRISILIYMMVQSVMFGVAAILILATPLSPHAMTLFPWFVGVTFLVSVPLSWIIAPHLRARFERQIAL